MGALIQQVKQLSELLQRKRYYKKAALLGVALLVLAGLLHLKYSMTEEIMPTLAQTSGKVLPIYCVQTQEPKIALTFDAAWGNEDTKQIMEILRKHNIKVTFFMTGGWVEKYPEDVKMILSEGHDLGNHSQNHKNMSQISDSEKKSELLSVHENVKSLTGYDMFLFRPPYGETILR